MKLTLLLTAFVILTSKSNAQIITPVIKANFGLDADLKSNFFNGVIAGGNDDWFNDGTPGAGAFMIDTTGAAASVNEYILDPTSRKKSFIRGMNYPMYSTVNGKLLYDALYVRDHYKNDSTAYSASNKNSQSPGLWQGAITPVPDKSDINDLMIHVRRDGPSLSDSLWFFAGLSLHGNTGNRYFDFELYQSDIYYNKTDKRFYNYGAEAGHTAWLFDALGNVTRPGDIIFTAEFGSSSLTNLEARIWIDKSSLSLTPSQFSWGGAFDGDGASAQYGYASIVPNTVGIFYGGNQCVDSTWAGPFGFVDVTDVFSTNYNSRDYMEIAVNMTKIGLDPYTILGSSCNLSFRKVFAKTRSAVSFTSDLKDFVGPYRVGYPEAVGATGDLSLFCGEAPGLIELSVSNPLSTSIYTWTTTDGNIVTSPASGTSINADQPGTYVVSQSLFSGCSAYATDTITIIKDTEKCMVLAAEDIQLAGRINHPNVVLHWSSSDKDISHFEVERSNDGRLFRAITIATAAKNSTGNNYQVIDPDGLSGSNNLYYRLKIVKINSQVSYSRPISLKNTNGLSNEFSISPNPASNYLQVSFSERIRSGMTLLLYNSLGNELKKLELKNANEIISLGDLPPGVYFVHASTRDGKIITREKLMIAR